MAFPLTISGPGRTVSNTRIYHWKLGKKDWNKMGIRTPVLLFYGVRKKMDIYYLDSFIPRSQRVNAEFRIYNEILLRGSSESIEKSYSKTTLDPSHALS